MWSTHSHTLYEVGGEAVVVGIMGLSHYTCRFSVRKKDPDLVSEGAVINSRYGKATNVVGTRGGGGTKKLAP